MRCEDLPHKQGSKVWLDEENQQPGEGLEAMGMCQYRTTAKAKEARGRTKACPQLGEGLENGAHHNRTSHKYVLGEPTQHNFLCSCCR